MDKQLIERRLKMYAGGACVMTAKEFALFYGITGVKAAQKLKEANVEKVSAKWFIPDIADKIVKNML